MPKLSFWNFAVSASYLLDAGEVRAQVPNSTDCPRKSLSPLLTTKVPVIPSVKAALAVQSGFAVTVPFIWTGETWPPILW